MPDRVARMIDVALVGRARLLGRFEHGADGAARIELDGAPAVLKAWPIAEHTLPETLAGDLAALASRGIPTARRLDGGTVGDTAWIAWELLDGEWVPELDDRLLDDLLLIVDRSRDAAPRSDTSWPALVDAALNGCAPWLSSAPASVEAHRLGRPFVAEARRRLARIDPGDLRTTDLVHTDLALENVLVRGGRVTAVVDVERLRAGDGGYDLMGVIADAETWQKASPRVLDRLWSATRERVAAGPLGLYAAMYAVRYLGWALDTEDEDQVLGAMRRLVDRTA